MTARLIPALLPGILVSVLLFWLMNYMIMPEEKTFDDDKVLQVAEFTRLKKETKDQRKGARRQLPQMQETQQKPAVTPPPTAPAQRVTRAVETPRIETPRINMGLTASDVKITMMSGVEAAKSEPVPKAAPAPAPAPSPSPAAVAAPAAAPDMSAPELEAPIGGGGDVVPRFRVEPRYPRRARMKRIEGWVKVEFTITKDGGVDDIEIIEAEPSGIFEESVRKAVSRWEFEPRTRNGQPVEQRATQTLSFSLTR